MKTSLITTIYNEEKTIGVFLESVNAQSVLPDEVIIVDGGSTDRTIEKIKKYELRVKKGLKLKVFIKKGNRSVGRNEGIRRAKNEIILLTDAGCILDKNWVKEINKPFAEKDTDVVAGYYAAKADTLLQKCLVPYALVMPDRVNPNNFLPATRSMAIRKSAWRDVGGFNVKYSHNEDYVFARGLRDAGKKILFAKNAIVYWIPRKTFKEAFVMFRRFAYGDIEAGIVRPKVVLLFLRYTVALAFLFIELYLQSWQLLLLLLLLFLVYWLWAIMKNYRFVNNWKAFYLLPLIQLTADFAVLYGSLWGLLARKN